MSCDASAISIVIAISPCRPCYDKIIFAVIRSVVAYILIECYTLITIVSRIIVIYSIVIYFCTTVVSFYRNTNSPDIIYYVIIYNSTILTNIDSSRTDTSYIVNKVIFTNNVRSTTPRYRCWSIREYGSYIINFKSINYCIISTNRNK